MSKEKYRLIFNSAKRNCNLVKSESPVKRNKKAVLKRIKAKRKRENVGKANNMYSEGQTVGIYFLLSQRICDACMSWLQEEEWETRH